MKKIPSSASHSNPVLFVHGMWHAAWCWEEHFLDYFARHGYEAYALSMRGHGASGCDKIIRRITLADYVSDIDQVVKQLKKPPFLVGHSMGGMIIQKYLETHQVPAAVMLASIPPNGLIPATLRTFLKHPLKIMQINLKLSTFPIISTPRLTREAFFSSIMPEEMVINYFSRMQDESYHAYWDMMVFNLPRVRLVKTPMLVLGAENDSLITKREVENTAKTYGVKAEFFPSAHDMMLEPAWESVAELILNFFES